MDQNTSNFIVDFGGAPEERGAAWCAVDIDYSQQSVKAIKELLKKPVFILPPHGSSYLEENYVLTSEFVVGVIEAESATD